MGDKNRGSGTNDQNDKFDLEFKKYIENAKSNQNKEKYHNYISIDENELNRRTMIVNKGICPICKSNERVNGFQSERVGSVLVFYIRKKVSFISCISCAVKRQRRDALITLLVGIWGIGVFQSIIVLIRYIRSNSINTHMDYPNNILKDVLRRSMEEDMTDDYRDDYSVIFK
mgnify:CR=1 FL=1